MIRKIVFLFAFTCCAVFSMAQSSVNITLGKPYPVVDADSKYYFRKGNEILTVKQEKKELILQKFNAATLSFQKIKVYDDFPKNFVVEKIAQVKNGYFVFYSWWDGDNELLFAREIDFSTGQFKDPAKKIISTPEKIAGTLGKTSFFGVGVFDKYSFYFSYDSTKMFVQYALKPKKKDDSKNNEIIGAYVFNDKLQEQWHGELTMPYTEKKMNNLDYTVDSQGNVYLVARIYKDSSTDEKKRGKNEANYFLEILKFSQPSGALTKTKVELADKFVHTVWVYENSAKDYMICAGFYNSGKEAGAADGILLFKLGNDGKYYDQVTHPIPLAILNQNAGKKAARRNERDEDKDKAEFEELKLREIRIQEDGSIILTSEQQYTVSHYHAGVNGRGGSTSYSYHYDDVLVAKVEADGKLAWMKKLPKRQVGGAGRGGMSFRYFPGKGTHNFVYLDNVKNKNLNAEDQPEYHRDGAGGFMTNFSIDDKTGDVTKTYMVDLKDVKGVEVYQFWPGRTMPFGNNSFIFEAYKKGKQDILIKVDIKK